ncbi:hypothetical protein BKA70DRAFT_1232499 [Coprinopsis sp. MPI-PUGE-AT-0042]|nr:hypothetical protein BKA70DRAFT_1232499 [Coprinopsis sp. MPI-PUGE-AT-0042]
MNVRSIRWGKEGGGHGGIHEASVPMTPKTTMVSIGRMRWLSCGCRRLRMASWQNVNIHGRVEEKAESGSERLLEVWAKAARTIWIFKRHGSLPESSYEARVATLPEEREGGKAFGTRRTGFKKYSLASKVKTMAVPFTMIPWQVITSCLRRCYKQVRGAFHRGSCQGVGSLPGNIGEKHSSSGKSQLQYSRQLALLAAWTISPASVASMVSRQLPGASFLLTSMDHLSGSVIGVGSLAGKNRKLAVALTPEEDCILQTPLRNTIGLGSLPGHCDETRVPSLPDGRKMRENRIVASSTMGCTATRLLNTSSTLIRSMETTLSHLTHTRPSWISPTINKTKPTTKRPVVYHPPVTHCLFQYGQRQSSRCLDRTKLSRCIRRATFNGNRGRGCWKNGFSQTLQQRERLVEVDRHARPARAVELEKNAVTMANCSTQGPTEVMGEFEGKAKGCTMALKKPSSGPYILTNAGDIPLGQNSTSEKQAALNLKEDDGSLGPFSSPSSRTSSAMRRWKRSRVPLSSMMREPSPTEINPLDLGPTSHFGQRNDT